MPVPKKILSVSGMLERCIINYWMQIPIKVHKSKPIVVVSLGFSFQGLSGINFPKTMLFGDDVMVKTCSWTPEFRELYLLALEHISKPPVKPNFHPSNKCYTWIRLAEELGDADRKRRQKPTKSAPVFHPMLFGLQAFFCDLLDSSGK